MANSLTKHGMERLPKPQHAPEAYINRELSWLEFNRRVLEEAADTSTPVLERLKFLAIFSSNLDEFFMIRVAGLQEQLSAGIAPQDYSADGRDPEAQLGAIDRLAHELVREQYRLWREEVLPELSKNGISRLKPGELEPGDREYADTLFRRGVYPVLTPLAIDPGHPFPLISNRSLNLALQLEGRLRGRFQRFFGIVQVPSTPVIDRVVFLPSEGDAPRRFILLEDLISEHVQDLFGGSRVLDRALFRLTRNTDLSIDEDEADDLLHTIEESLRDRMRGAAVRLEIDAGADEAFISWLAGALDLEPRDLYRIDGPLDLAALMAIHEVDGFRAIREEPLKARTASPLADKQDIFAAIREQDILIHHPYESFSSVVEFISRAADDPDVLAIKQTLYRTSVSSPILDALARSAQNGKQVTALVELKARFDEANNINWARSLEQAGVHVVYGVVGLKTHCKAALVVRREADGIRRYVHLSTGNYNPTTARVYTDLGLFTVSPDFGEDTSALFNLLTGYSQGYEWRKLVVAPFGLRERTIELIEREAGHAANGRPARIIAKMNSLVEPSVIDALYRASRAGVEIDLVVRGICCLRPGRPGLSENIRVISIVDKFLEHSRIFYFAHAGEPQVFLSSADWMPRNFFRRIEVMFPIEAPELRSRIIEEILAITLADNVKARELQPDGSYLYRDRSDSRRAVRSQLLFQDLARAKAAKPGVLEGFLHTRTEPSRLEPTVGSGVDAAAASHPPDA